MRKVLAWLAAGIAVGVALGRILRRRRRPALPADADAGDPRADALRAQLAATRQDAPAPATDEPPAATGDDVDEARRRVHERGRAAVDEMRRSES